MPVKTHDLDLPEQIQRCVPTIVTFANRLSGNGAEFDDLFQAGLLHCIKCFRSFRPEKGASLLTYMKPAGLLRVIRTASWNMKASMNMSTSQRATMIRQREAGTLPEWIWKNMGPAKSMDAPMEFDDHDGDSMEIFLEQDLYDDPDEAEGKADQAAKLNEAIATLDLREREIIRRRFGLGNDVEETLKDIGEDAGLTRERIRQIEEKALRKLRRRLKV